VLNNLVVTATFFVYASAFGERTLELSGTTKLLLGAGTTAGVVMQAVVLLPFLRGERLRFRIDLRDEAIARVMRLAAYVIGYVVINQIGLWVVLALANGVAGGVTSWQVAFIFFQLPHGLFAVSLQTAIFPDLTRSAADRDWPTFRARLASGIRGVAFLLSPAAVGYIVLADPITRLVIARGVADANDAASVASVLEVLAVGLVFYSLFHLLTRSFYALPDTRTPTMINAIAVAVNIAAAIPLYAAFGVRGLGAAHALAYACGVAGLLLALRRRIGGTLGLVAVVPALARIVAASTVMGVAVAAIAATLDAPDLVEVGVCVGAGAILYLAFSQVAGVDERKLLFASGPSRKRQDRSDEAE
jgi:putative peptidoglycan lipid II flippase